MTLPSSSTKRTKRASSMPFDSAAVAGHSTRSERSASVAKSRGVGAGRRSRQPARRSPRRCAGCRAGPRAADSRSSSSSIVNASPSRSSTQSGRLRVVVQPLGQRRGRRGIERAGTDRADGAERARCVELRPLRSRRRAPVRNPIEERWPSPIWRTLMTNRSAPCGTSDWSGCATMRGVAQRRRLDGVLVGERRPQQQPPFLGQLDAGFEAVADAARRGRRKVRARSRWRAPKRPMTSRRATSTSSSSRARMRSTTPVAWSSLRPARSWPGTNSWAMTRAGFGTQADAGCRVASPASVTRHRRERRRAVLEGGDHGERRLRPLVQVRPCAMQPVVAAPGRADPTSRCSDVVVARRTSATASSTPSEPGGIAGHAAPRAQHASAMAATSMRLLVEGRRTIVRARSANRSRREVAVDRLAVEQPAAAASSPASTSSGRASRGRPRAAPREARRWRRSDEARATATQGRRTAGRCASTASPSSWRAPW